MNGRHGVSDVTTCWKEPHGLAVYSGVTAELIRQFFNHCIGIIIQSRPSFKSKLQLYYDEFTTLNGKNTNFICAKAKFSATMSAEQIPRSNGVALHPR